MAEPNQLIWIPVSCGKTAASTESEACNVQYDSDKYPSGAARESVVSLHITDAFVFNSSGTSAKLKNATLPGPGQQRW